MGKNGGNKCRPKSYLPRVNSCNDVGHDNSTIKIVVVIIIITVLIPISRVSETFSQSRQYQGQTDCVTIGPYMLTMTLIRDLL